LRNHALPSIGFPGTYKCERYYRNSWKVLPWEEELSPSCIGTPKTSSIAAPYIYIYKRKEKLFLISISISSNDLPSTFLLLKSVKQQVNTEPVSRIGELSLSGTQLNFFAIILLHLTHEILLYVWISRLIHSLRLKSLVKGQIIGSILGRPNWLGLAIIFCHIQQLLLVFQL